MEGFFVFLRPFNPGNGSNRVLLPAVIGIEPIVRL